MSITPNDNDVLFGRGFAIAAHPGNQLLRTLVREHKPAFLTCNRKAKRETGNQIVTEILKLGGRFLIEDPNNIDNKFLTSIYEKAWVSVELEKAVDKVMHRLREKEKKSTKKDNITGLCSTQSNYSQEGKGGGAANNLALGGTSATDFYQSMQRLSPEALATSLQNAISLDSTHDSSVSNAGKGKQNISYGGQTIDGYFDFEVLIGSVGKSSFYLLEASKNHTESFPMSVTDFLKSGQLSNHLRLAHCEDKDSITHANGQPQHLQQPAQILENSVIMALSLTRLILEYLPKMDLSSIQLDDFHVNLHRNAGGEIVKVSVPSIESTGSKMPSSSCFEPEWVHLRIDILSPTKVDGQRQKMCSNTASMRTLGKLLYSVFSLGESPPFDIFTTPTPTVDSTEHEDGNQIRSFQRLRMAERTVFSRLIEGSIFPTSICRLLSDLIDTGPKGKADSPFTCFEDVIHDLEQMMSKPQIFLYGPFLPLTVPRSFLFGHSHHGRKEEVDALSNVVMQMEQSLQASTESPSSRVEAVFVSGIAGSGKTYLIQSIRESLISSRWSVIKAKFERGKKHVSRRIVSSMFDELIVHLVKMRDSKKAPEIAYSHRASESILGAIGHEILPSLADFLPSLPQLFDNLSSELRVEVKAEDSEWRLIYSLSKILEAVLNSNRFIMICCDDLQWADKTELSLISEVLVNVGSLKHVSNRCLFVGSFRHDEIDENHPFSVQYSYLQMMTSNVNTTDIKLSSFSKKDIAIMISEEFHLPCRVVSGLADIVHKKTSGLPFFVVELLNSLLRDSIITYSSPKQCYSWDVDTVSFIQTEESVAELIASNVKSLPLPSQEILRIISCFGIQTDVSLLHHLDSCRQAGRHNGRVGQLVSSAGDTEVEGMMVEIEQFCDMGILDRAGPIIMFTHDLILEAVYESMSLAERQRLHLAIGECLGGIANVDAGPDRNQPYFTGSNWASSLISIACDHVNALIESVGSDLRSADITSGQKLTFAKWNLAAGKQTRRLSNNRGALYYFSKGIAFLGQDCWDELGLCLALHEGALHASFELGESDNVAIYAEMITSNTSFDDSFDIQPLVLRSLSQCGKHRDSISKGIEMLRMLGFDIHPSLAMESIMNSMNSISADQMISLCENVANDSDHQVLTIMDAMLQSCISSTSPYLQTIICEMIKFSLEHGITEKSTLAFATFAMLKINIRRDYAGGRYWADITKKLVRKLHMINKSKRIKSFEIYPKMLLYLCVDIWFMPAREISLKLLNYHQKAMEMGHVDFGMLSLQTGFRFRLLGGEQLSLVWKSSEERLRLMSKQSKYASRCALLDNMLLTVLTGESWDFFSVFEGSICNLKDLQDDAKSSQDALWLQSSNVFNVLIEYWKRNYMLAEEYSNLASAMLPMAKLSSIYLIYHTFFRGLIMFRMFQQEGGDNKRLNEGMKAIGEMEKWAQNSMVVFGNKWYLLLAEHAASIHQHEEALKMYEASIKASKDHGNIHELALAHELLGNYYHGRGCQSDSIASFKQAYVYYNQWGATAVAERLLTAYSLADIDPAAKRGCPKNEKHPRQCD